MRIKRIVLSLLLLVSLASPVFTSSSVSALFESSKDEACIALNADKNGKECDPDKLKSATEKSGGTIENVIDLLSVVVGILAVIMLIIAGFRFITSGGDSGNVTNARNTAIYAIVGLILVAFAQIIVKFVLQRI